VPPVNPVSTWRQRFSGVAVAGATLCGAVTLWATGRLPHAEWRSPSAADSESKSPAAPTERAIDRAVFEKNLWMSITKPGASDLAEAAVPKPKELPLEVDLIGISEVNGSLVAALYDRRADRLVVAKSGDSFAGAQVSEVTRDQVTLQRGAEQKVLVRRRPGP
jgi:hypothetical protein